MKKIRTLIIEDEIPAKEILHSYLTEIPEIEVVGEAQDGFSGIKAIAELKPDLIFLDIQMPKLNGFEMLELIDERPEIIFTTAYDQFALKAFELNAIDYLMKPFHKERLIEAVQKVVEKLYRNEANNPPVYEILAKKTENLIPLSRIVVKKANAINIIPIDKIKYFAAEDDYVMIYHEDGKALKQQTMKYYEDNLPKEQFVRVHRSYIIKISEINKIEPYGKDNHIAILNSSERIPISRSGFALLKEKLNF